MAKKKTKLGKRVEKTHKRILELRIARLQKSMDRAAAQLVVDMDKAAAKLAKDIADMQAMVAELAAIVAEELPPVVVVEPQPAV